MSSILHQKIDRVVAVFRRKLEGCFISGFLAKNQIVVAAGKYKSNEGENTKRFTVTFVATRYTGIASCAIAMPNCGSIQ